MKEHTYDYDETEIKVIKAAIEQANSSSWGVDAEDEDQIRETDFRVYKDYSIPDVFQHEYLMDNMVSSEWIREVVDEDALRRKMEDDHEEVEVDGVHYTVAYCGG